MLKLWIARDMNGDFYLYKDEPIKTKRYFRQRDSSTWAEIRLDKKNSLGEGVTFENSPKELNLVEIEQVEKLWRRVLILADACKHYRTELVKNGIEAKEFDWKKARQKLEREPAK